MMKKMMKPGQLSSADHEEVNILLQIIATYSIDSSSK